MNLFEKAAILAIKYHKGQTYCGYPYILHLLEVAAKLDTEEEKVTAILHDILEDTSATIATLIDYGIPKDIIQHVIILTRSDGIEYFEYIDLIKVSKSYTSIPTRVKLADLKTNLEYLPSEGYNSLKERYEKSVIILEERE